MEQITQYLKEMKFKRRIFGGVDEESVLVHIKKLGELYQQCAKEKEDALIAERDGILRELDMSNADLEQFRVDLERKQAEYANLQKEHAQALGQIFELQAELTAGSSQQAEVDQARLEYEMKSKELMDTIQMLQQVKSQALEQAKVDAAQEIQQLRGNVMADAEQELLQVRQEISRLQGEIDLLEQRREEAQKNLQSETCLLQAHICNLQKTLNSMGDVAQEVPKKESGKVQVLGRSSTSTGDIFQIG